jgi:prepilin-type N-terminal cleavage/methylation domain-containing protein
MRATERLRTAFTLIELLIVVAIIAILAAIAVPNFLEAQTRAKVSRAVADMRSIATAIEAYRIDWNKYAPNDFRFYVTPIQLTTPIAYITSRFNDPFARASGVAAEQGLPQFSEEEEIYSYWRIVTLQEGFQVLQSTGMALRGLVVDFNGGGNQNAFLKYGKWLESSLGPDKVFSLIENGSIVDAPPSGVLGSPMYPPWGYSWDIPYNPTNGTVSFGNIHRSQLNVEGTQPDPNLL